MGYKNILFLFIMSKYAIILGNYWRIMIQYMLIEIDVFKY